MFEAKIAKGIEFLNRECPEWLDLINLDKLELSTACDCVLGQSFMHRKGFCKYGYDYVLYHMNLGLVKACEYGFSLANFKYDPPYEQLTKEWHTAISNLLKDRDEKRILDVVPDLQACQTFRERVVCKRETRRDAGILGRRHNQRIISQGRAVGEHRERLQTCKQ